MGRHIFVTEEKVLLNYFYCAPNFFFISSTIAPQNKSKHRALFSECGGAYERLLWDGEYEAGKEKKLQYTHYKN